MPCTEGDELAEAVLWDLNLLIIKVLMAPKSKKKKVEEPPPPVIPIKFEHNGLDAACEGLELVMDSVMNKV